MKNNPDRQAESGSLVWGGYLRIPKYLRFANASAWSVICFSMKNANSTNKVSNNLKYMHVLIVWDEITEIVGGDKQLGATLTRAFFLSQLAGATPNPDSQRSRRARAQRSAIKMLRRGNPRERSKPNR